MYVRTFFGPPVQHIRDLYVGGRVVEENADGTMTEYRHQIEVRGQVISNVASVGGQVISSYVVHFDTANRPVYEVWVGMVRGSLVVFKTDYTLSAPGQLVVRRRASPTIDSRVERITPIVAQGRVTGAGITAAGDERQDTIMCEYDENGRLRAERIPLLGGSLVGDIHDATQYVYDEAGRVVRMIDWRGRDVVAVHHVVR